MSGAPSSAAWRRAATTWSRWFATSRRHAGACDPASPCVADYDDASALKQAFADIDELVLISSDGDANAVMRHHANAIEAAASTGIRHVSFTSIVDVGELSPFHFAPVYRDAEQRLAVCGVSSTILRCGWAASRLRGDFSHIRLTMD
jgi:uncharacterized protein YbjT (DUF2867 family)